ncbi:short-chain dehydrogenase/reductase SDR [Caballeronia hypogeia]|uniref:Short-chain dehydrogenase/reductase SDR n=1 Tax=Caballeronia hypogeia TaxID=1777140 RepID=A0A158ADR9_9BURK|nr:SDR family NAD(P)-dependent oxidoreductase [Caballeronia hypogeia]SAK55978.1 short-chain dehydrogenase/reductase SDR [Caballeronia hypogeia]
MDLGLQGKTALVCGASRGLGYACASALVAEGVDAVIVAREPRALDQAAHTLNEQGAGRVIAVAADIAAEEGRVRALAAARELRDAAADAGFDIVVTNAGGPPAGNFRDWSTEDWMRALNVNMLSAIELMRATIDGMIARGFGRIVNITSTAVKAPSSYLGLSNGARCGLTGFVAGVAREVAPHGVTINNLLPGTFDTARLAANFQAVADRDGVPVESIRDKRREASATRRFGTPEEFGAMCAFMCSVHAGYLNAQNILLDGGTYPGTF